MIDRMPGRVSPPFCAICRRPAGDDCPDRGLSPRQVRRRLGDTLRREAAQAISERREQL